MAHPIEKILKGYQKSWLLLAQAMIWIAAVITGFLLAPPAGTSADSKVWVRFAQFVITILIGLLLLAALRWKRKKDMLPWAGAAALFLLAGTVVFFGYQIFSARWTTLYAEKKAVIGSAFTAQAGEYSRQNPNLTPGDLLMHYAGDAEKIWTRESLQERRLILASLYVLAMPLFATCIICLLQAIECATATRAPGAAGTRKRTAAPASAKEAKEIKEPAKETEEDIPAPESKPAEKAAVKTPGKTAEKG